MIAFISMNVVRRMDYWAVAAVWTPKWNEHWVWVKMSAVEGPTATSPNKLSFKLTVCQPLFCNGTPTVASTPPHPPKKTTHRHVKENRVWGVQATRKNFSIAQAAYCSRNNQSKWRLGLHLWGQDDTWTLSLFVFLYISWLVLSV